MQNNHKCLPILHFGDEVPLSPEILQGVADSFYATGWINMLSSPKLWGALRRIPPKAFLIERLDAWLVFARKSVADGDEKAALVERRSIPFQCLRDLLVDWEPPTVTPEIREAARTLHISEFGRPPDDDWDRMAQEGVHLEAALLWPEGEWDEQAFLAQQASEQATPSK